MPKKIFALIGWPISHSLSPAMHNAALRSLKIDAEYKLFPLKPEDFNNFLAGIDKNNIRGFNVTIPYKEKILTYLPEISEEVRLIQAVNTVLVEDARLKGFNTDGRGFYQHLSEDLGFSIKGKKIALIGAGGAARAVSVFIAKADPQYLFIYDVDSDRVKALVEHLKNNFPKIRIEQKDNIESLDIKNADLLINATPIGMKDSDSQLVDSGFFHKNLLVYDLIYNPKETKLLKEAREKGAKTSNGLGMLLYQGMLSFEIWTNVKPPKDIMRQALLGQLK